MNKTGKKGCYCYSFFAPLYDQQGEWTLTVTELVGFGLAQPADAAGWAVGLSLPRTIALRGEEARRREGHARPLCLDGGHRVVTE